LVTIPPRPSSADCTAIVRLEQRTSLEQPDPKPLRRCTLPLTAPAVVDRVVTDIAAVGVTPEVFLLREYVPRWTVGMIQATTDAPLRVADDVQEMAL